MHTHDAYRVYARDCVSDNRTILLHNACPKSDKHYPLIIIIVNIIIVVVVVINYTSARVIVARWRPRRRWR